MVKAKWDIMTQSDGRIEVVYRNFIANLVFECGSCRSDTPLELILEYIHEEGDPGDYIFQNGRHIASLRPTVFS